MAATFFFLLSKKEMYSVHYISKVSEGPKTLSPVFGNNDRSSGLNRERRDSCLLRRWVLSHVLREGRVKSLPMVTELANTVQHLHLTWVCDSKPRILNTHCWGFNPAQSPPSQGSSGPQRSCCKVQLRGVPVT
jgi:hypothetical protein